MSVRAETLDRLGMEWEDLLSELELPPVPGLIRPRMQTRVLKHFAMFQSDACSIALERLAKQWSIDDRHLRRVVEHLTKLGLLYKRIHRKRNYRGVNWLEVERRWLLQVDESTETPPVTLERESTGQLDVHCPDATGQSDENCPDVTGQFDAHCPDDPGNYARTKQELENKEPTTTNGPLDDEWLSLLDSFKGWMIQAKPALMAAREARWTPQGVIALRRLNPEVTPGVFCNWLMGDDRCPMTREEADEAARKYTARDEDQRRCKAQRIREQVQYRYKGVKRRKPWVCNGQVARELQARGYDAFITEDERAAAVILDEKDAERKRRFGTPVETVQQLVAEVVCKPPQAIIKQPPSEEATEKRRRQIQRQIAEVVVAESRTLTATPTTL